MDTREINEYKHIRQHQANERTFLAWMRTAMTVTAFGFIVGKFSVMAGQIAVELTGKNALNINIYFAHVGMIFIAIGTILAPTIYIKYKIIERNIIKEIYQTNTYIELFMTVLGLIMGILFLLHLLEII